MINMDLTSLGSKFLQQQLVYDICFFFPTYNSVTQCFPMSQASEHFHKQKMPPQHNLDKDAVPTDTAVPGVTIQISKQHVVLFYGSRLIAVNPERKLKAPGQVTAVYFRRRGQKVKRVQAWKVNTMDQ